MLFYLMGKSASGKDTIYAELLQKPELGLKPLIMYTTRPIRDTECDGREYYFVDDAKAQELEAEGKVIELRAYDTKHGVWKYFTVDNENLDVRNQDYIGIGTLESYEKIRNYYGCGDVIPVYIEVDDGIRLERALKRERKPQNQKYEEMCRRFLADAADYSEDKVRKAGIERRFYNNTDRAVCFQEIQEFISDCQLKKQEGK